MNRTQALPIARVLGISIEALDMDRTLDQIARILKEDMKGYICFAGVHGVMEAQRDPRLAEIYAESVMTLPDGTPTVWIGRWQGHKSMKQVTGPELMLEVFQRSEFADYTHFFYGGREGVAQQLQQRLTIRFPWARVVGTYTPPFRELNQAEEELLIARIRELKPDMIWVGISTPRQERFMRRYLHRLDITLMFGVGAAFDIHVGRIQDAPQWIKRIGMQWLHRLMQDPGGYGSATCVIIRPFSGTSRCNLPTCGNILRLESLLTITSRRGLEIFRD